MQGYFFQVIVLNEKLLIASFSKNLTIVFVAMFVIVTTAGNITDFYHYSFLMLTTKKETIAQENLYQSQFTLPPIISGSGIPGIERTKRCSVLELKSRLGFDNKRILQQVIQCYQLKQFQNALLIMDHLKKVVINKVDRETLAQIYFYQALIALEQGKLFEAEEKIKHLFFLKSEFNVLQQAVKISLQYQAVFNRIKQQKRQLGNIETDDVTGKSYTRVLECDKNCYSNSWQEQTLDANDAVSQAIDCSIDGTCDDDLDCSINGTCDDDLDCSINGTCNQY